jgi:UDP:flavonoid glycosyltransferase YjiC (YdhE family)
VRVLFSSTWGYGHVLPMVPLARAFAAAGHTVHWAASGDAGDVVTAAGLDAVPAGLDGPGVADVQRRLREALSTVRPQDKAAVAFPTMFGEWVTPPMVRDLLPLARELQPDLLVHEHAEHAAPLVGAVLGVPSVTHAFGGAVPAAFLVDVGERLGWLWAEHGLTPPPYAGAFTATYLDICPPEVQMVPVDHVPTRQPLRPVTYTGEPAPLPAGVGDDDPRPLVYLTLGTVSNQAPALRSAVEGLAGLDARVLVTVGPDGDPAALGPVPDHVTVARWVNQADVLPHCAAVVSHGGSGTFLGALGLGLPQMCLPLAADQFRNAAAADRTGAGLSLAPDATTPDAVRDAVRRLLLEDGFRRAASGLADTIRAMPGPAEIVTVLERLVPEGR